MSKLAVYLMPGLAASPLIFENIKLPTSSYELIYLEWFLPHKNETLQHYAKRMCKDIKEDSVLIGVSFGGILVQEMAKQIRVKKLIIISSVKSHLEFPQRIKIAKTTKAYKILPTNWLQNIETLVKYSFGNNIISKRLKLYEKYLQMRDKAYLDWAIEKLVLWENEEVNSKLIHIHGEKDEVFPIKNIKNCIIVKNATHTLILHKYKWLNENLPKLIEN